MSAVINNLFAPFNVFENPTLTFGVLQYVTLEVLVSRAFRFVLNEPAPWSTDFFVHIVSIPFLGGLSAFFDSETILDNTEFIPLLLDGAQGIPAVFAAQFVLHTFQLGFTTPHFNLKDLLITAASKAITRPISSFLYHTLFPSAVKEQWDTVDMYIQQQKDVSQIKTEPSA